jgi:cytochrome b involved in lipid metabolism
MDNSTNEYTREEISIHDGSNGTLWVIIHGKVYDMSTFKHPGGKEILMDEIGEDRGDEFDSIHSPAAKQQMEQFLIGTLKEEPTKNSSNYKKTDGDAGKYDNSSNPLVTAVLIVIGLLILGFIFYINKN